MNIEKKTKIIRKRFIKKTKKYLQSGGNEPFNEGDFKELIKLFVDKDHKLNIKNKSKEDKITDLVNSMKQDPIVFTEVMSKYYFKFIKSNSENDRIFSMVLLKNKKIDNIIDIKYIDFIKKKINNLDSKDVNWSDNINDSIIRNIILKLVKYLFKKKTNEVINGIFKKYLQPDIHSQLIYYATDVQKNIDIKENKKKLFNILFNNFGLVFFFINLGMIKSRQYFTYQKGGTIKLIEFNNETVLNNKDDMEQKILDKINGELKKKGVSLRDVYNKVNNIEKPLDKDCTSDINENIHENVIDNYNKDLLHTLFMYKKK